MKNKFKKRIFLFIPLAILALAVFTFLFQLLWNSVVPDVFNLIEINYWQALGILAISKILFSGFGFNKRKRNFGKGRMPFSGNFSPEDKLRLREEWKNRCSNK